MTATKTLSVAQLLVLSTAAQRSDHFVLPLPPTLRARGASQQRMLGSLLKAELVEELSVSEDALCWRQDENGQRFALRLTAAGIRAVTGDDTAPEPGVPATPEPDPAPIVDEALPGECASRPDKVSPAPRPSRPNGKLGQVLDAVATSGGAMLEELVSLTGWQPHTARAAVTGLRQRGFGITLADQDGRKAYRLTVAD